MRFMNRKLLQFFILATLTLVASVAPAQAQIFGGSKANMPDIVGLVERHGDAVVNISTTSKPRTPDTRGQMPMPFGGSPFEDMFRDFFEQMPQQPMRPSQSLGSGVIISPDGFVVTNNHVVQRADDIMVRLNDETEYKAELVGADSKNDLALLKIDTSKPLPFTNFGDSDSVRVGEWVVAIGNPFGLGGTVTTGIISARGRHIGAGPYDDFFQTDAAINPGNSGGPLFNLNGEVIGINTAILSRTGGNQGIGFSIPSNIVQTIVEQIKEHGRPIRGWLGVRIQKVTDDMAAALNLQESKGALVSEVESDSPAERAGLQVGDVVLRFNGEEIARMTDLPKLVAQTEVGSPASLTVLRDGKQRKLTAQIGELEEDATRSRKTDSGDVGDNLGLQLTDLSSSNRQRFDVDKNLEGALVVNVAPGSSAMRAGIRPGDVILRVGKAEIASAQDALDAISKAEGDTVLLLISRQGSNMFVPVRQADDEK